MSSKKRQTESEVNVQQENVMSEETSTAITVATPAAITVAPAAHPENLKLAQLLPLKLRDRALRVWRPTATEMEQILSALSPEMREKVNGLFDSLNTVNDGLLGDVEPRLVHDMKLYHGVGSDPLRPKSVNKGQFYASNGMTFDESFVGAVIAITSGRTLWPARGSSSNAPICYSVDGEMGSELGECAKCEYAQKKYLDGGCSRDMTVYFVDREFTGIYSIKFGKTSYANGITLSKVLQQLKVMWSKWVQFEASEQSGKGNTWHTVKAGLLPVSAKNKDDIMVAPELLPVLRALNALIVGDVYLPRVAKMYSRPEEEVTASVGAAGDKIPTIDDGGGDYSL